MKAEEKSSVKTIIIALLLMAVVFFGLYKMDKANTDAHSHNGGASHAH